MQVYNDELYHYGKVGMKWGHKRAKFAEGIQAQKQANYDQFRHPIHSTSAQISMLKKNPIRTLKGGTKVLNELNADVKNRVNNSNKMKVQKKVEKQQFKKETRQMYKDQLRHPMASLAAQGKLVKEHPLKALNMDLKSTKELNADVKRRVDAHVQKKKKIKEYEKEINSGESRVGRIYNKLTGAGKYQAEIMYAQKHKNK